MVRLLLQRCGEALALLLALSLAIFSLGTVVPGDAALTLAGVEGVTPERLARLRDQLGLSDPLPIRYWHWLSRALRGDFGDSLITGRSITDDIRHELPVSLELAVCSLLLATLIGVVVGVYAAGHVDSLVDKVLRGGALLLLAVPTFVSGLLLVLVGSTYAQPLYASFYVDPSIDLVENLRALILPSVAVALPVSAMIAQMARATMIASLREDFVVTARAKGVSELRVQYLHALRAAVAPVMTLVGLELGSLIAGLIIVEQIFSLPGLGRGVLSAILARDYPFVIAGTLVIAGIYLIVNLLVDVLYPVLDPRQRIG